MALLSGFGLVFVFYLSYDSRASISYDRRLVSRWQEKRTGINIKSSDDAVEVDEAAADDDGNVAGLPNALQDGSASVAQRHPLSR